MNINEQMKCELFPLIETKSGAIPHLTVRGLNAWYKYTDLI
jgi:hypothetical protein